MASTDELKTLNSLFSRYGTATPYLALFNSYGEPLMNKLTGIPLGEYVTNFNYKGDEEKENQAKISFDCADPDIIDQSDLREHSVILLQWGYIFNNGAFVSGPLKAISVRDVNSVFDSTGVHVTLVCLDSVSSLRHLPPCPPCSEDDLKDSSFMNFLDEGCYHNVPIIIEEFANVK